MRLLESLLLLFLFASCTPRSERSVQIAFIGPLTGGVAANGLGGRNSADLAVRLHNAKQGANYRYELLVRDDECKPNVGVQAATRVGADPLVIAVVAHYCSTVAMGTIDIYHRFGLPIVIWGAVLPDITYANDFDEVHRVNGTMINQNQVAVRFMVGLKYRRWVVIHDTTDYGKGHNEHFSKALKASGGAILATFPVGADQQDFNAELTKIRDLKPEVIYFGGLTPIGVRIRSQMDRLGIKAVFQGTSGIFSDAFIEGLGPLSEGSLAFREGAPAEELAGGKAFIDQYAKQNYGEPPEAYGPFAFAAANLIMDAIEKVGPDRRKVRKELNATKDRDSVIGKISFDDHGQNTVDLISKFVVQDGKWVVWERSDYATGKRKLQGSEGSDL